MANDVVLLKLSFLFVILSKRKILLMENKKVLVIEDDSILSLFYRSLLKRMGYSVVGVINNSNDVANAVNKHQPDILLMDVKIAGDADGIETAREIRTGNGMPIIFTTGNSEPETVKRAKEVSNSYYLVKPILEMDLKKVLDGLYAIA